MQPRATTGGGGEHVARLDQGEQRPRGQHHPADEGGEGVDRHRARSDRGAVGGLATGEAHGRDDSRQRHEPTVAKPGEGAAQVGDERRRHQGDLGREQGDGIERGHGVRISGGVACAVETALLASGATDGGSEASME